VIDIDDKIRVFQVVLEAAIINAFEDLAGP